MHADPLTFFRGESPQHRVVEVDEIAARTETTKRMIYYYFGSKKQLYLAVLEGAYARIRAAERTINVGRRSA